MSSLLLIALGVVAYGWGMHTGVLPALWNGLKHAIRSVLAKPDADLRVCSMCRVLWTKHTPRLQERHARGIDPWAIFYPDGIERMIEDLDGPGLDLVLAVRQWVENGEPMGSFQLRRCPNGHVVPQGRAVCPDCPVPASGLRVVPVHDPDTGEHLGDLTLCARCGESTGLAYGYCGPCNMREAS